MEEIFRDFYGCVASIVTLDDGSVKLTIRGQHDVQFHEKEYSTYRGAKIAMGRLSDGWYKVV